MGGSSAWCSLLLVLATAVRIGAEEAAGGAAILILGQSLRLDGSAPGTLVRRAEKAAELYHLYPERRGAAIVPSGGDPVGVGVTEASAMRTLLLRNGVSDANIHLEDKALTTIENVLYAIPILRGLKADRVTVVTSDFHMPRASLIVEAIFQNQTYPGEFALTLVHADGGCADKDALPGADINDESLVQRLRREVQNVRGKFHVQFFTSKDLDARIPIPSGDRLRHALYELGVQLAAATAVVAAPTLGPSGLRGAAADALDHSGGLLVKFLAVAVGCGGLGVLLGCAMRGPFSGKVPYLHVEHVEEALPPPSPMTVGALRRQSS